MVFGQVGLGVGKLRRFDLVGLGEELRWWDDVNSPNRYTTGTSIGPSKGLNTNHKQQVNNQFANDVWQSR